MNIRLSGKRGFVPKNVSSVNYPPLFLRAFLFGLVLQAHNSSTFLWKILQKFLGLKRLKKLCTQITPRHFLYKGVHQRGGDGPSPPPFLDIVSRLSQKVIHSLYSPPSVSLLPPFEFLCTLLFLYFPSCQLMGEKS